MHTCHPAKVAIIGSGDIGSDLMMKVIRLSESLEMGAMVGIGRKTLMSSGGPIDPADLADVLTVWPRRASSRTRHARTWDRSRS